MAAETFRQESSRLLSLEQHLSFWQPLVSNAKTPEEARPIEADAESALDLHCASIGLMRADCIVSGTGAWSELIDYASVKRDGVKSPDSTEEFIRERTGEINDRRGVCLGFETADIRGNGKRRLLYKFMIGQVIANATPTYQHIVALFMYAEPETAIVIPVKSLTGSFEPVTFDALTDEAVYGGAVLL